MRGLIAGLRSVRVPFSGRFVLVRSGPHADGVRRGRRRRRRRRIGCSLLCCNVVYRNPPCFEDHATSGPTDGVVVKGERHINLNNKTYIIVIP